MIIRFRVVLCGEVFSPNLGDQAIAVCMAHLIETIAPEYEVKLLDLSGRRGRGGSKRQNRGLRSAFSGVRRLGRPVRCVLNALVWLLKARWQFLSTARSALRGADLLVVGGGQLLADNDWYFPLRLAALSQEARRAGVRMIVYGCGVAPPRTKIGTLLLRRFLSRTQHIAVRDRESIDNLRLFGVQGGAASVTLDPAVVTAQVFDLSTCRPRAIVGIGIISPDVLARHSDGASVPASWWLAFWTELIRQVRHSGLTCEIFTNGDSEDLAFAQLVQTSVKNAGIHTPVRHPMTVQELVQGIKSYEVVVGHRLHAAIIAFATGVPSVGFRWDRKLEAFFARIGKANLCVDPSSFSVDGVVELIHKARKQPQRPDELHIAYSELRLSLAELLRSYSPSLDRADFSLSGFPVHITNKRL